MTNVEHINTGNIIKSIIDKSLENVLTEIDFKFKLANETLSIFEQLPQYKLVVAQNKELTNKLQLYIENTKELKTNFDILFKEQAALTLKYNSLITYLCNKYNYTPEFYNEEQYSQITLEITELPKKNKDSLFKDDEWSNKRTNIFNNNAKCTISDENKDLNEIEFNGRAEGLTKKLEDKSEAHNKAKNNAKYEDIKEEVNKEVNKEVNEEVNKEDNVENNEEDNEEEEVKLININDIYYYSSINKNIDGTYNIYNCIEDSEDVGDYYGTLVNNKLIKS